MPQFAAAIDLPLPHRPSLVLGSGLRSGLAKKVLFADVVAQYATPIFNAGSRGKSPWASRRLDRDAGLCASALLSISPGYSDMAIGLALMIGMRLPAQFQFTLQSTLADRFLAPLAHDACRGSCATIFTFRSAATDGTTTALRQSSGHHAARRLVARRLVDVRGLGGHSWARTSCQSRLALDRPRDRLAPTDLLSQSLTLVLVMFAWVPFRADTLTHAVMIWRAMFDVKDFAHAVASGYALAWIGTLGSVVLFAPNSQQILTAVEDGTATRFLPEGGGVRWAAIIGAAFGVAVATSLLVPTSFLYFRF